MSLKVDIKIALSPKFERMLEDYDEPIDKETAEAMGEAAIREMKSLIADGKSPVEGVGKFLPYKDPDKYPGKRKAASPVNLKLSGDFLESLTQKAKPDDAGFATELFYEGSDRNGVSNEIKEKGHAAGANRQPKRPTLPVKKGSTFAQSVRLAFSKIAKERILRVLKGEG